MRPLRHLLLCLTHELGSGRALENAARELDEVERIFGAIDALGLRVAARQLQRAA
jgi:hypothetical protein